MESSKWCNNWRGGIGWHRFFVTSDNIVHFQSFQSPNSRSKPFNVSKSNFTFFGIFLLFIKYLIKSLYSDRWIFVPIWINPKKIQKNVKFDLQAHFNISIKLNGLDRLFGLWKCTVSSDVTKKGYHPIPPLQIYHFFDLHYTVQFILKETVIYWI